MNIWDLIVENALKTPGWVRLYAEIFTCACVVGFFDLPNQYYTLKHLYDHICSNQMIGKRGTSTSERT